MQLCIQATTKARADLGASRPVEYTLRREATIGLLRLSIDTNFGRLANKSMEV